MCTGFNEELERRVLAGDKAAIKATVELARPRVRRKAKKGLKKNRMDEGYVRLFEDLVCLELEKALQNDFPKYYRKHSN